MFSAWLAETTVVDHLLWGAAIGLSIRRPNGGVMAGALLRHSAILNRSSAWPEPP